MAGADRVSALPLELKISILSLLDINDILRTSVLSRSWRHVWTHIPNPAFYFYPSETNTAVLHRVDHVLSSLLGPIFEFRLMFRCLGSTEESAIKRFLQIIFEKGGLNNLWIFNTGDQARFRLPGFDSLKELYLSSCSIELPHGFEGFRCLTKLNLYHVCVSENDLRLLINESRKLTTARIFLLSTESISVTVSAPLLTELHFRVSDFVKSVKVVSAPCLREARIIGGDIVGAGLDNLEENVETILKFMTSIASVSSLTLDFFILVCFSLVGVPETLPLRMQFHELKYLRLYGTCAIMNNTFYSLLKSTPFIERLEIEYYGDDQDFSEPIQSDEFKKQDGFSCLDRTLKSVKIIMRTFNIAISRLMPHFILVNASVLKLMGLKYRKCAVSESELKMLNELHQIKPVSSDAMLIIRWY